VQARTNDVAPPEPPADKLTQSFNSVLNNNKV